MHEKKVENRAKKQNKTKQNKALYSVKPRNVPEYG